MLGKKRRLNRILKNGRTMIAPMDHGISCPVKGLENMDKIIQTIDCGADAVVVHKGIAKNSSYLEESNIGLIVHLSASTSLVEPNDKRIITSVEKAIQLGADAVSVHVNVGCKSERSQLIEVSRVEEICDSYGLPLLAMMYPRGEGIEVNADTVKHAVRVGYEMGADIIKTSYTGSSESFKEVTEVSPVPIVIAGGSKISDIEMINQVNDALSAGASGVAIGRNVFQHKNPEAMVKALRRVIHDGNVELAKEVLYERDLVAVQGR